jgi:HlyD family type I secretion membrane fusion protein
MAMLKVDEPPQQPTSSLPVVPPNQSSNISYEDINLNSFIEPAQQISSIYGGVASSVAANPQTPAHSQLPKIATLKTETVNTTNWSTSLQAMLDQPPSTLPRQLLLGGMVFCLAFGAWANFGQIDEVGHAQGRLVPKGEPYKIHPVVLGKVADINIKEGSVVKAGQELLALDSQIATNEVSRLIQEQAAYRVELIQTQGLIVKTRLESQTLAESANADAQAQKVTIAQANSKTQGQEAALAQAKEKAATTRALLAQSQVDITAYQARLTKLKPLVAQGALGLDQLFQVEQQLRDKERTIIQDNGDLRQTERELDQLQAEQKQASDEPSRLQAELAQKQAQARTVQVQQAQKIQQLEVQKTQLLAKIEENQKLLTKAEAELKQLSLTAPVDGVVLSLNLKNRGEVVQPGQTIAEIAPHAAPLILSTSLPNREAGFVKTGMPVQVKLDAYPYQDYGIMTGKVIAISPDSKPDEKLGAVYRVDVALNRTYVTVRHQNIQLKAGQTATAEIIIRRRRIIDMLLDPIRQLQKGGIDL